MRSPAKILPAPQSSTSKVPQRILLKSNSNPTLIAPNQLIQVAGSQPITAGQIHQINIPGKGVGLKFLKFNYIYSLVLSYNCCIINND